MEYHESNALKFVSSISVTWC